MRFARSIMAASFLVWVSSCGGPNSPSQNTPNYAGTWNGTYTITGCTQSGGVALANICGSLGSTDPYQMVLAQSNTSVTGSFTLGTIQFPSTGATIGSDGSLSLSATTIQNGITIIVTWNLNLPASAITGSITQVWTSTTLSGQANVTGIISTAIRS